jgi:UDP:flavonoid glycosyltransferase YjiC (YdhE family)
LGAAVSILRRLFIDRIAGQVADYQTVLVNFAADVILVDLCCFGAATLHDLGGPIWATLGINPLVTLDPECPTYGSGAQPPKTFLGRTRNRFNQLMGRWIFFPKVTALLNTERKKLGLLPLPNNGFYDHTRSKYLHIMPTTLVFEYPRQFSPNIHFVGPLLPIPAKGFMPPQWWHEITNDKGEKKIAHVTQGTYATDSVNLIHPTIQALSSMSYLVLVVTTPDAETAFSGVELPTNVRIAPFIPHSELLKYVDVMITNAGYNGVLAALSMGVPLVCAGRSEDKADVSARVAWTGAGIDLGTDSPSEGRIRNAVENVLQDEKYKKSALKVKKSFEEHQSAVEACNLLERLAKEKCIIGG